MVERNNLQSIRRLTFLGVLTAATVIFQLISVLSLGPCNISLALIPVGLGAALFGIGAGAWLGLTCAVTILLSGQASWFLTYSVLFTVFVVVTKGVLAGAASGVVFRFLEKKQLTVASICSAVTTPVVNTGLFVVAALTGFRPLIESQGIEGSYIAYLITAFVGFNFIFEFASCLILVPVIYRVLKRFIA